MTQKELRKLARQTLKDAMKLKTSEFGASMSPQAQTALAVLHAPDHKGE